MVGSSEERPSEAHYGFHIPTKLLLFKQALATLEGIISALYKISAFG